MPSADPELTIYLPRFGVCAYRESEVLSFPWGLPGFESLRRFIAIRLGGREKFVWLQSLDDLAIALPTADPWLLFSDYEPHLPEYASISLDIARAEDFAALCVIVVRAEAHEATMNLCAPIIINLMSRMGRQVVLESGGYSVQTPVPGRALAVVAGA